MPHCVIEYSKPVMDVIDLDSLLASTHTGLIDSGLFDPKTVKSRAYGCDIYRVGDLADAHFIHIRIAIMPGRSDEQKLDLLAGIFRRIETMCEKISSLTMEVVEINQAHYFKALRP